jgi:putative phosphoesterase
MSAATESAAFSAPSTVAGDFRIGLISDTHGLVRPEALAMLAGCQHIVHAGDIGLISGQPSVLDELNRIAPTTAVRGNNDQGGWAKHIPETQIVEIGGVLVFVIHDLRDIDFDPATAGVRLVVSGHSHKALIKERDGVCFVNPGSAGPRRFSLPVTVADVVIRGNRIKPRILTIPDASAPPPKTPARQRGLPRKTDE